MESSARWAALRARARDAKNSNEKAAVSESRSERTEEPSATSRKTANAQHKLLKAETEEAGQNFERKRAWDYTVEESEKWDRRMDKKARAREDVSFQDYRQDARKIYKRQRRDMKTDVDAYEKEKIAAVEKAAASGSLEIIETEDGELIAVDNDGMFYSTANSTEFLGNKPDREAIDRLVTDLRKAEETRLRKRRERGRDEEEGDVTYINDQNAKFNKKLARFYNKYTAEIRDSFERGTMI